ncbi:MAG: ROK family protein, partial [Bacteroidota bacterium]
MKEHVLGIDVGATGIKGAIIDVNTGKLVTERVKFDTPHPATPEAMSGPVKSIVKELDWDGLIGCGFPAIVKNGKSMTASNIDIAWIGTSIEKVFKKATGLDVVAINDADAAGLAEAYFGAGKDVDGAVLLITIGTGI